ncbi:MAG: RIP metalloprotease RseP [Proteobacteria bacterium]|nr:MAG: RIP metalloprotease RseP [Pseudomonadota bacterium]
MMTALTSIFWLIITLGVLVTFHELGHFLLARLFGVKVLRFSVGFGKPIWSRLDRYGTEIAVAPIPLGGYVKMLDERDCEVSEDIKHQAYNHKPAWQKFLILFAGPAFNFILAFVLYWMMFVVGKPEIKPTIGEPVKLMQKAGFFTKDQIIAIEGEVVKTWSDVSMYLITAGLDHRDIAVTVKTEQGTIRDRTLALSQLPKDIKESKMMAAIGLQPWKMPVPAIMGDLTARLPAANAGLQRGDLITAINGKAIADWYALSNQISKLSPPIILTYQRQGQQHEAVIKRFVADPDDPKRQVIGIRPMEPDKEVTDFARSLYYELSYGPLQAMPMAWQEMQKITGKSLEMMGKLLVGKASLENLSGPITIAQVANDSAGRGFSWYLSFLALISLSLGIINLLPIPMLDGGQILFLMFEKIKGAPLSEQFEVRAQLMGMLMLVSLMSLAIYNDILRTLS